MVIILFFLYVARGSLLIISNGSDRFLYTEGSASAQHAGVHEVAAEAHEQPDGPLAEGALRCLCAQVE